MTLPDRVRTKIRRGRCWTWTAAKSGDGYGRLLVGSRRDGSRRVALAHRYVYEVLVGPIPRGRVLDHLCRNRSCVNPAHLEPVTPAENTQRGDAGRYLRERVACPRGHRYDAANTRHTPDGKRACRACDRLRKQENRWTSR